MSKTTGPVLLTGALAWANNTILSDDPGTDKTEATFRIGVATGVLAAAMYGLEKVVPDVAIGISYIALVSVLLVRINNKPTPLERILKLAT